MFFSKQEFKPDLKFEGYRLEDNPFPPEILDLVPEKFETLFQDWVMANETNRFRNVFRTNSLLDWPQNYWAIKGQKLTTRHKLVLMSGLIRSLIAERNPEIFCVYATLPVVFDNPQKKLWELFADRFLKERFRKAAYSFVLSEISALSEDDAARFLPGIDVPELIRDAEESEGKSLDNLFFPPKATNYSSSEQPKAVSREVVEGKDEDAADSAGDTDEGDGSTIPSPESPVPSPEFPEPVGTGSTRPSIEDEVVGAGSTRPSTEEEEPGPAEAIISFLELKSLNPPLAKPIFEVILYSLKKGFEKGREKLQDLDEYTEAMKGLLALIDFNYASTLLIIDHLDGWFALKDVDQAKLMGAITEFNFLSGKKAFIILSGSARIRDEIGAFSDFQQLDVDLPSFQIESEALSTENCAVLISSFLRADFSRVLAPGNANESDIFPFTEEGISELSSASADWNELLIKAGELIELGAKQGFVPIDSALVKEVLTH